MTAQTPDDLPRSPALDAFFAAHEETGTPTEAALKATWRKLDATLATANVVPLPRRAVVPPEVWAVAAVLLIGVVAQVLYLVLRTDDAQSPDGVRALYRTGQLAEAQRLASSGCTAEACRALSTQLLRALELAGRLEALTDAELTELEALDRSLSADTPTELTDAVRERRLLRSEPVEGMATRARSLLPREPAKALEVAQACLTRAPTRVDCADLREELLAARDQEVEATLEGVRELAPAEGLRLAQTCAQRWPGEPRCLNLWGTAAQAVFLATRDAAALEVHRLAFERFAAATGAGAAGWESMLPEALSRTPQAPAPASPAPPPTAARLSFEHARRQWAQRDFAEAVTAMEDLAAGSGPVAQEARATLVTWRAALNREANDVYGRAYALQATDPQEALRLFREVTFLTEPDSEVHQKALARISALAPGQAESVTERATTEPATLLTVKVGGVLRYTLPGLTRMAVGDDSIATVELGAADEALIRGVAVGEVNVLLWSSGGRRALRVKVTP